MTPSGWNARHGCSDTSTAMSAFSAGRTSRGRSGKGQGGKEGRVRGGGRRRGAWEMLASSAGGHTQGAGRRGTGSPGGLRLGSCRRPTAPTPPPPHPSARGRWCASCTAPGTPSCTARPGASSTPAGAPPPRPAAPAAAAAPPQTPAEHTSVQSVRPGRQQKEGRHGKKQRLGLLQRKVARPGGGSGEEEAGGRCAAPWLLRPQTAPPRPQHAPAPRSGAPPSAQIVQRGVSEADGAPPRPKLSNWIPRQLTVFRAGLKAAVAAWLNIAACIVLGGAAACCKSTLNYTDAVEIAASPNGAPATPYPLLYRPRGVAKGGKLLGTDKRHPMHSTCSLDLFKQRWAALSPVEICRTADPTTEPLPQEQQGNLHKQAP